MSLLIAHAGTWTGTNAFRLMPNDPFEEGPATAAVSIAAAGHLTSIAYTWAHPQDGAQEGLLVVGARDEPGGILALWGDSWHQQPEPKVLRGAIESDLIVASYEYGAGWQWRITVDATVADALGIRMANVIPESTGAGNAPASAYDAMVTTLRRVG